MTHIEYAIKYSGYKVKYITDGGTYYEGIISGYHNERNFILI